MIPVQVRLSHQFYETHFSIDDQVDLFEAH